MLPPTNKAELRKRPRPTLLIGVALMSYAVASPSILVAEEPANRTAGIASPQSRASEKEDAVLLARRGDTARALQILERLRHDHPDDVDIARDLIVVSAWAGRDADAVRLFSALPRGPHPDYVLEAVALSYRHLNQPADALLLYREGSRQSPGNPSFVAGEIRSLVDLDQVARAIEIADGDLQARGDRPGVLLAAGYAASAQKKPIDALRYIDRALKIEPVNREAQHDRILAINDMGAPQVARALADNNPGILSPAELRRIDGDWAAALVRWGIFEPQNEKARFVATDRAIAVLDGLIAGWSVDGDAEDSVRRARFDRMVALRDRVRMADAVAEYRDLVSQDTPIPVHALIAAADAALYLRNPEMARDLYLQALDVEPRNAETRLGLFYAYVELNDFAAAYRQVDAATADQPTWLFLKGQNDPVENPDRSAAELAAAHARFYSGEMEDAHRRIAAIVEAAPHNTRHRTAHANVYSARGWPRRAAEEYEISRALEPENVATEVGQARNSLQRRDYRAVESALADLMRRFPENLEVQRLDRLWKVHNMAELRVDAEQSIGAATNTQGGNGLTVGAQLYSQPVAYNWRLFGAESVAHTQLPEGEGAMTLRRSAAGVEYRGRDLVTSLEGTLNAFGPDTSTTLGSDIDSGRGGARALATWSISDYWQVSGGAALFAHDTPLRALRQGITSNTASTALIYRESESREFLLAGEIRDFSDGNVRTGLGGRYTERWVTRPHLTIDGILGLASSHNSADANRPYYNPRQDALASYGVSINHELYRRYELVYDHHLVVTPGVYWEQGFGSSGTANVLYEHRIRSDDVLEAGLGVTFGRRTYDGNYESTVAVLFNARLRF